MKIQTGIQAGVIWYKVQAGDNLGMIARAAYGANATPDEVILIYQANAGSIGLDPCTLPVGSSLLIPDLPQSNPQPYNPPYSPPAPKPKSKPMPGACTEHWGNGVCLFKSCPYPPFTLPC